MKNLKTVLLVGSLACAAYGVGRAQENDADVTAYMDARFQAQDLGEPKGYADLTALTAKLPRSPSATKQAIRYALVDGFKGKGSPSEAVLIAQNARIIELLEQLNKKSAKPEELPYRAP